MGAETTIERIDLDVLLKCLNALDGLEASSITKSERPDFIITRDGKKIGVEHTRAVYGELVRANKLHRSAFPDLAIDLTQLKDSETRRSNKEIVETVTNPSGLWKKSDDCRSDWKEKIAARLKSKRKKYNQWRYQFFDENWLLIHDFPPLPASFETQEWAGQYLKAVFLETSSATKDFDTVFVHSGQYLFRWHKRELDLADTSRIRTLTLVETDSAA